MDKYIYMLVNISSLVIPLIFTFHHKIQFYKTWKQIIPAILIPAIPLIIWDIGFTEMGIWGFNERYLTGYYLFNLPIEEILFFICIPYACLFTFYVLNKHIRFPILQLKSFWSLLILITTAVVILNYQQLYTLIVGIFFILSILFIILTQSDQNTSSILFVFGILMIPFLLVNGILTGAISEMPIVWYNDAHHLGIRIVTIPLNDVLYAFVLLSPCFAIYNSLESKTQT